MPVAGRQIVRIDAEVPDVNSADHDFPVTIVHQATNLFFDVGWAPAAKARPNAWDYAVRTFQNTTILDLYECPVMPFKFADACRHVNDAKPTKHIR